MEETTKKTRKAPARPRKTAAKKAAPEAKPVALAAPEPAAHGEAAEMPAVATNGNASHAAAAKPVSRDDIAQLAHKYWAERGRQDGHHVEDWLRAERDLRQRAS
jgi:hypothetical protein